jgi:hypothetical protein
MAKWFRFVRQFTIFYMGDGLGVIHLRVCNLKIQRSFFPSKCQQALVRSAGEGFVAI